MGWLQASTKTVSLAFLLFLIPKINTEENDSGQLSSILKRLDELQQRFDNSETSLISSMQDYFEKFEEQMINTLKNQETKLCSRIQQLESKCASNITAGDSELEKTMNEVSSDELVLMNELLLEMKTLHQNVQSLLNTICKDPLKGFESSLHSSIIRLQDDKNILNRALGKLTSIHTDVNSTRDQLVEHRKIWNDMHADKLKCKKGWLFFEESCYFFGTKEGNWTQGRDKCRQLGANYVKITNDDEWEFIAGHVTANSWIGLNDLEEEGTFIWASDNSTETTDNNKTWWHDYQPDNYEGKEDCVHYWLVYGRNRWNDNDCSSDMRYICETTPDKDSINTEANTQPILKVDTV